jgi:hypothetical protein
MPSSSMVKIEVPSPQGDSVDERIVIVERDTFESCSSLTRTASALQKHYLSWERPVGVAHAPSRSELMTIRCVRL